MTAKELKDEAKWVGYPEQSTEEVTEYIFTEEEMAIFWSKLCEEQRHKCAHRANGLPSYEYIYNTPEPEFE